MVLRKRGLSGTLSPERTERETRHRTLARRAAAEGMVLLHNDGTLPLKQGSALALYGIGARYTIIGGTGSGSVNCRDSVTVDQGLRNAGLHITSDQWLDSFDRAYADAREKWMADIYANSVAGDFFSLYTSYSSRRLQTPEGSPFTKTDADTAVYVISRVSGESVDRREVKGDYYLSDVEAESLRQLSALYPNLIVVLNVGGVIDLSFMDEIHVSALVLMSQAGMEGGNALADVLTGAVAPSGKLTDTWAMHYADYPGGADFSHRNGNLIQEKYEEGIYVGYRYFDSFCVKPRYAFGFGLSYTEFAIEPLSAAGADDMISAEVRVTNTGKAAGRETVQLYAACPRKLRAKENKRLVAFGKTRLLQPGESQTLTLHFDVRLLASYHTAKSQYYLEAGDYVLLAGSACDNVAPAARLTLKEFTVTEQLSPICPLLDALTEITPPRECMDAWDESLAKMLSGCSVPVLALEDIITAAPMPRQENDPALIRQAEQILQKMTPIQKARIVCGQPSHASGEVIGAAAIHVPGAAGETTNTLTELGIGSMILADGPAGIRVQQCYEIDPADGHIYQMVGYESLENRFFGKQTFHEGTIRRYQFCTAIPVGTLLAQTFDPELMEQVGSLIGAEMKEIGVTLWLAPGMNIHRNPLCGRNFEYYAEDPVVSGVMAAAVTAGVQRHPGVGTTIKHFACNNQEDNRMGVSSIVSERALREIYLKGFEIAVKQAQPMSLMTSYNRLNSVHTANSYDLCTTVARNEWGMRGSIMTDWVTTNQGHGSSAVKCVQAGNDMIMPGNQSDILEILDALEEKKDLSLKEADLDKCVMRVLLTILQSDVFEDARPYNEGRTLPRLTFAE